MIPIYFQNKYTNFRGPEQNGIFLILSVICDSS